MIKAAKKIQKGYYPADLKDEITVLSTTVTEKDTVDLHTDLSNIKVENLDDFYATYYSFIVCLSGKIFSKAESALIQASKYESLFIMEKKENQFEDAVFNRYLSAREISGLQYLGSYAIC